MPVYLPCSAQTLRSLITEIQQFRDGLSSPGFVALSDSLMSVLWNMSIVQFTGETTGLAIEALEVCDIPLTQETAYLTFSLADDIHYI